MNADNINLQADKDDIIDRIGEIKCRLLSAYSAFNNLTDQKLIESCIYEMNSLQSKYNYYLHCAKKLGIRNTRYFKCS